MRSRDRDRPGQHGETLSLLKKKYFMVYVSHIFPVQSIINGHLGWFQVFAIVNSAAMNIPVRVSL